MSRSTCASSSSRPRRLAARAAAVAVVACLGTLVAAGRAPAGATAPSTPSSTTVAAPTTTTAPPSTTTTTTPRSFSPPAALPVVAPAAKRDLGLGYDLVEANGTVTALGRAGYFGSADSLPLVAPVIDLLPTPDGEGYWLVSADGGVLTYGDAPFEGSAGGAVRPDPVVSAAATPDGKGYWLVTAAGHILPFGDAHSFGQVDFALAAPIVAIRATPDGRGYWLVARDGGVFTFGDAKFHGSLGARHLRRPIVAAAVTPDGGGYWLVQSDGNVWRFGEAARLGGKRPGIAGPVVGFAANAKATGGWLATRNGEVARLGTADSHGSLSAEQLTSPVTAISAAPVLASPPPNPFRYPSHTVGYDINWPQCAGANSTSTVDLPGPPGYPDGSVAYTVTVVGVDGWAVDSDNPCLRAEVGWAKKATGAKGAPYELYLFLNAPASTSTADLTGPKGTCSTKSGTPREDCLAYNYGYNAAKEAVAYGRSEGARSSVWWIDVENDDCAPGEFNDAGNGQYWSCDQSLNALTIQAAIDALRASGATAGIYSTSVQYGAITGGYVPSGAQIPLWIAGAYWTSPPYPSSYGYPGTKVLAAYCGAGYRFAGGVPWLLQETPGPNDYPFDPDYAC